MIDHDMFARELPRWLTSTTMLRACPTSTPRDWAAKAREVRVRINKQSPNLAGGVPVDKENVACGVGKRGDHV